MMFVGFRMRVLQLSKGTGNPQDWVRMSMQAVTYSILVNTLLVLLVPLFTDKEVKRTKEGDLRVEVALLRPLDFLVREEGDEQHQERVHKDRVRNSLHGHANPVLRVAGTLRQLQHMHTE